MADSSNHQGLKRLRSYTVIPPKDTNRHGMEVAFTRRLTTAAVDDYRANYRRFRKGKARGAHGERPSETERSVNWGDDEDLEDEEENKVTMRGYEEIMDFRMSYRRYRLGHSHGAKGDVAELSQRLSFDHARLLPVAQLAALMRAQPFQQAFRLPEQSPFHLHIGAGRLGLGLVLPAIRKSGVPFALLQRPSGAWTPISTSPNLTVALKVNDEDVTQLTVVQDIQDLPAADPKQPNLLVLSDEADLVDALVSRATSFSISLGGAMLDVVVPLLKRLPICSEKSKLPPLFAAENDHKMVHDLGEALEGKVEVIDCMVDRICVDRQILSDAIAVTAEPYKGEMVILKPPSNNMPPPFDGNEVCMPQLEAQANYYCRRKFLMVNGTHTTLAFMTLCLRQPPPESEPGDFPLIDWDPKNCGEQYYNEIWAWAVARLLIILWEHELPVLRNTHGVKSDAELCDVLLNYATNTLRRFSSIKDTTARVLKGGVANRWETRLKAVHHFLTGFRLSPVTALLFSKAKIRLSYLKQVVGRLSDESERFTGLQVVQKHKVVCT